MEWIAAEGKGQFYNVPSPDALPQIFIKETAVILKSAIYEEPFKPQVRSMSEVVRGISASEYPSLLGYVATTPKPRAETPLWTDKGDPLLAHWQYGLGRAVAFTSDAKPKWGKNWLNWDKYRQFWSQIANWSLRRVQNADFTTDVTVDKGEGVLSVEALDAQGKAIGELPEQVPYQEWLHSDYKDSKSCQSCHMPVVKEDVPITSVLGEPRADLALDLRRRRGPIDLGVVFADFARIAGAGFGLGHRARAHRGEVRARAEEPPGAARRLVSRGDLLVEPAEVAQDHERQVEELGGRPDGVRRHHRRHHERRGEDDGHRGGRAGVQEQVRHEQQHGGNGLADGEARASRSRLGAIQKCNAGDGAGR